MLHIMRINQTLEMESHKETTIILLFFIINDFASVSSKLYYVLFTYKTNVFISGNNSRKLINTIYIEPDIQYAWLQSNKLTFNLLKTHYMVFHRAKHKIWTLNCVLIMFQFNKLITLNFRSNY